MSEDEIKEIEAKAFEKAAELAGFWMIHDPKLVVPSLRAEAACRRPGYQPRREPCHHWDGDGREVPCTDPDKMHGAGDQFPGSDYP